MEKHESAVERNIEFFEVIGAARKLVSGIKDKSLLARKMWVFGTKPNSRDKYIAIATSNDFQESDKSNYKIKIYGDTVAENANELIIQNLWEKSKLPIVIDNEIAENISNFDRDPREEGMRLIVDENMDEIVIPLLTPAKKVDLN